MTFTSDLFAQVIRRDEKDQLSGGDPHEVWHRFSGRQMGYVGNSGTLDTDYNTSINNRTVTSAPSLTTHADFDLAYDSINSYTQGSTRGMYVVQAGDTLSSIAAALWGDASLWYKLAEITGLTAESTLVEGLPLIIPAGVVTHHNTALTYQPYDPLDVLGAMFAGWSAGLRPACSDAAYGIVARREARAPTCEHRSSPHPKPFPSRVGASLHPPPDRIHRNFLASRARAA